MLLMRNWIAGLLLTCVFAPFIASGADRTAEGHWEGAIELPAMKLKVEVDLSKQSPQWSGSISIPQQNAKNIALTNISGEPLAVSFSIVGVSGNPTFKGSVSEDDTKLSGTFTQGPATYPFALERKAAPDAAAADALKDFDAFVAATLKPWEVPGLSLAIVKNGKVVLAKGFGQRDVKNNLPVTADTLFPIGSATKAFTTFTMGTLVDEGKLAWDQPVRSYLHDFQMYDPAATLALTPRDLVTHRSGLPRHDMVWYNNQTLSRKELVARLRYLKPNAELREKWQYNNLMYLTAGYLIEQLTATTWEEAVRQRVLTPLGMKRTTFADTDSQKDADFAKPYAKRKEQLTEIPFREVGNMGPAGSINSSANEMSRWVTMQLAKGKYDGKQLIQAATLQQVQTPQMAISALPIQTEIGATSYAMGWMVGNYRGHLMLQHGGNIDGFSALVVLFPFDDVGMVVLTNANATPLPNILVSHAADKLFGAPDKDWNGEALIRKQQGEALVKAAEQKKAAYRVAGTKPSHATADYVGEYYFAGYGTVSVAEHGGTLRVRYNGISTPLEHWHYDVFNCLRGEDPAFADQKLQFQGNADGAIASLTIVMEPNVEAIVFSKRPDAKQFDPAYLQQFVGEYQLGPQTIVIATQGNKLFLSQGGQAREMVPALGGWYEPKGIAGVRLRFDTDAKTKAVAATFHQPNGVFTITRK